MTTQFPTNLDTFVNPVGTNPVTNPDHAGQHANINDSVKALETKVGKDGSAVTTSHDYKLSGVAGSDKAVSITGTETLTNKTLTTPVIASLKPDASHTLTMPVATDTLVGKDTTDTLTNKTLTTPTIGSFANANHNHQASAGGGTLDAAAIAAGTIATARLGSGTANNSTFLRGDQTYAVVTTTYAYGDGSDGDVTISGTVTLTRDMYYNNLTVNSPNAIVTGNWRIFVKGTLTGNGGIAQNGNAGGAGGNGGRGGSGLGGSAGTAGAAITGYFRTLAGQAGGIGGQATPGAGGNGVASVIALINKSSVAGGNGGNASNGGALATGTQKTKFGVTANNTLNGLDINSSYNPTVMEVSPSSGGGGGGTGGVGASPAGGGGGGSGSSGGCIFIVANVWAGTFYIQANGGNGGNGGTGSNGVGGERNGDGGGGGGGGNGGVSVVVYGTKTWTGSYSLTGGTKGALGAGGTGGSGGGGANGAAGTDGASGISYELDINTLTR